MEMIFTRYLPATGKDCTHIKVELYYSKGGMNMFTYKTEPRGYYLSVGPVQKYTRETGVSCESFTAFRGTKWCIKEVTRKSKKAEAEAVEIAHYRMRTAVEIVCQQEDIAINDWRCLEND